MNDYRYIISYTHFPQQQQQQQHFRFRFPPLHPTTPQPHIPANAAARKDCRGKCCGSNMGQWGVGGSGNLSLQHVAGEMGLKEPTLAPPKHFPSTALDLYVYLVGNLCYSPCPLPPSTTHIPPSKARNKICC